MHIYTHIPNKSSYMHKYRNKGYKYTIGNNKRNTIIMEDTQPTYEHGEGI